MNELERRFKVGRGDLIYGFDRARDSYINNSPMLGASVIMGCWIMANDFNNNTILGFNEFHTPSGAHTTPEDQIEIIEKSLRQLGKEKEGLPFIKELYKRYPPSNVRNMDDKVLKRAGDSHNFKMIRRSCKFGIEYVAAILPSNAKIHFLLDFMPTDAEITGKKKIRR